MMILPFQLLDIPRIFCQTPSRPRKNSGSSLGPLCATDAPVVSPLGPTGLGPPDGCCRRLFSLHVETYKELATVVEVISSATESPFASAKGCSAPISLECRTVREGFARAKAPSPPRVQRSLSPRRNVRTYLATLPRPSLVLSTSRRGIRFSRWFYGQLRTAKG